MTIIDKNPLSLFNSLSREIEPYAPVHKGEARVYTCGPTVYNYPHIGNMRAYVFADTLGRALTYKGYKLTHVINITDVGHLTDDGDEGEDKLEKMASEKSQDIWDIARHYTNAYWHDIKALNIREPAKWSIATDYVPAMIEFAKSIADKHCYELDSGLYFDTASVEDYGRLARAATEDGEGRIEAVAGKRNAADFAIWRKTPAGEKRQMEWDSPWGKGAPGWHLECSVMSKELLGFPFDIHTGGIDHREIHHANEIAQNQAIEGCGGLAGSGGCAENSGAKMWMHNNFLIDRSGKMSKSSGEFLRVQLLKYEGYHPLAYRMMCLQAHYQSELEFSWENLESAKIRLKRILIQLDKLILRYLSENPDAVKAPNKRSTITIAKKHVNHPKLDDYINRFDQAISNNLNTPEALPILEQLLRENELPVTEQIRVIRLMFFVFGFKAIKPSKMRQKPKYVTISLNKIEEQLAQRKAAKMDKDFEKSDAIRDALIAQGVEIMDGDPLGWDWKL